MRKGIKIKTSLIFLCWLMIIAHNVIPHNHQESDFCKLKGHFHAGSILNDEIHNQGDDNPVCNISGLLFHHFSHDNLIFDTCKNDFSFYVLQKELITDSKEHFFYNSNSCTSAFLRGPPAA